jgi:sulfur-carrier protein
MQVRVFATLRDVLGTKQIDVPLDGPATVGAVLENLVQRYPALGRKLWNQDGNLTGSITVMVNGRAVQYLSGLDTQIGPDDNLTLFPPIGGG